MSDPNNRENNIARTNDEMQNLDRQEMADVKKVVCSPSTPLRLKK